MSNRVISALFVALTLMAACSRDEDPTGARTDEFAVILSGEGDGNGRATGDGLDCLIQKSAASGTCSLEFARGSNVTLTASASSGSAFTGWSGACSGTDACALTLRSNQMVVATFMSVLGQWEAWPDMPVPVRSPGVATDGQKVYVIGGYAPQGRTAVVQILDLESRTWSFGPSLPEATDWGAAAWAGGRIHFLGGVTEAGATTQHLTHVPGAATWQAATAVPRRIAGSASIADGSTIYLFAGNSGEVPAYTATTLILDAGTGSWSSGTDVPGARINWSGARAGTEMFLIGGGIASYGTSADLLIYNPATNAWRSGPPIPLPREAHGVGSVGGIACAVGGRLAAQGNFNTPFNSVLCFDTDKQVWLPGPNLPVALQEVNVVSLANGILALGGANANTEPVSSTYFLPIRTDP